MILIIINVIMIAGIIMGEILTLNYKKEQFVKKEYRIGMGLAIWLEEHLRIAQKFGGRRLWEAMDHISGHDNPDIAVKKYFCSRIRECLLILLIVNIMSVLIVYSTKNGDDDDSIVDRPEYGQGSKEVRTTVRIGEGQEQEITYNVSEREPSEDECNDVIEETKEYIDEEFLGDNESADCVNTQLNLVDSYMDGVVNISWVTDEQGYIDANGNIEHIYDENGIMVEISAFISYMNSETEYIIPLRIMPYDKEVSETEKLVSYIENVDGKNKSETNIQLPDSIDGEKITYINKDGYSSWIVVIVGIIAAVSVFYLGDKNIKNKEQQRKEEMLIDFPEVICKFCVLLKAGMTIKGAWGKIVEDHIKSGSTRYAYEEMKYTWNEMKNGLSEIQAYEDYGNRCGLLPYGKFATWIIQQGRKGAGGLISLLELEMYEARQERNKVIMIKGEKMSTKLLFPMMGLMGIVMALVIIPAFYGMW